ncbi:MAG TPA: GGDEF-domain containing protein [Oxalobacteraceae bacterium]|nr:GGDEF-domain containing protein [Oxalobacteraceae bacterium]
MGMPKETAPHVHRLSPSGNNKFRFSRKNLFLIFLWPVISILVLWLLWGATSNALDNAREEVRDDVFKQANAMTSAYAIQLRHTIEQIDHITLTLKYEWEHTDIVLNLEDRKRQGLFPESVLLYAHIVDRSGNIVTTTLSAEDPRPNLARVPYFMEQKTGRVQGLLISGPRIGLRSNKPTIWFSRRVEYPDGTFGGVAVAAVETPFLTSFRDESVLGAKDIIMVRYIDGPILAVKSGNKTSGDVYRTTPVFSEKSSVIEESPEKFEDRQARIVSWEKLDKYPLVAIAMLSRQDAFSAFESMARRYRNMASAASLFLVLLACTGTVAAARLAWRRQQAEDVKVTYRAATDAANEGFYIMRPLFDGDGLVSDFEFEDCNERGGALIGLGRSDIVGHKLSEMVPGGARRDLLPILGRAMDIGFYEDEIRVSPPSRIKATWIYRRLVRTNAGLTLTLRDISQDKAHEQALAAMANTDALTTLPNRHWLMNYLPTAVEKAGSHGTLLAILFIDLDNFKNINDTLGHDAGDELLREAAVRLKKALRTSDHVVRLGGDEFMVILEQVDAMEDVSRVAGHIVKSIGAPFTLAGTGDNHVNASIGISMFPRDGGDGATLVKHADVAMYAAKAAGKGRYRYYESHLSDSLLLKLDKEQALRHRPLSTTNSCCITSPGSVRIAGRCSEWRRWCAGPILSEA